jgi:hypothetical protein
MLLGAFAAGNYRLDQTSRAVNIKANYDICGILRTGVSETVSKSDNRVKKNCGELRRVPLETCFSGNILAHCSQTAQRKFLSAKHPDETSGEFGDTDKPKAE